MYKNSRLPSTSKSWTGSFQNGKEKMAPFSLDT
jgi:hypothetical protein